MRRSILIGLTLSLALSGATMVSGAVKKPAPKKPVPKKIVKPVAKAAAPTVQLAGDNGLFGKVYSIRKDRPLYFRLKSAEYTTEQVLIDNVLYVPKAGEKLLVVHFAVQNPNKDEEYVRWDSLKFTAVDKQNSNCEGNSYWGNEDDNAHPGFAMSMKPAQTSNIYAVIIVPAKGIVPKLMVMSPNDGDGPILRYDLTKPENKVAPLKAPVADPDDASGYTALETVKGELNVAYPYSDFDITVQKFETTKAQLNKDEELEEGAGYFVATLVMKNESCDNPYLRWDTITPVVTSTDGEELQYKDMLLATANRPVGISPKLGAETTVRIYFTVPDGVTPKTLSLKQGDDSRAYEFDVQ